MYDPLETDISRKELAAIFKESIGIPICLIGGWASYFYVNEKYKRAFGKEYMGSRDIDIFFDPKKEKEFLKVVNKRGFAKNGFHFSTRLCCRNLCFAQNPWNSIFIPFLKTEKFAACVSTMYLAFLLGK